MPSTRLGASFSLHNMCSAHPKISFAPLPYASRSIAYLDGRVDIGIHAEAFVEELEAEINRLRST
jgi:hypothetical protein